MIKPLLRDIPILRRSKAVMWSHHAEAVTAVYDVGHYVGKAEYPIPEDVSDELTSEDFERSCRFARRVDQSRSILSRYLLRANLAMQMDCHPRELIFKYERWGKPYGILAGKTVPYFNVSHAGGYIGITVSQSAVGIDLEKVECRDDLAGVVRRQFAAVEHKWFERLAPEIRTQAFYMLWTRKESLAKAIGCGIADSLKSLVVLPGTDWTGGWAVQSVSAPKGYAVALSWRRAAVE